MKRTILKISCVAVLVAAVAVAVFSCNKEKVVKDSITTETVSLSKSNLSGNYIIATAKEGDVEAHLLFDKGKFESLFQDVLTNHLGKNCIFDDISIWDENPADMNIVPALRLTILNTKDGTTLSYFMLTKKHYKDGLILYDVPTRNAKENPVSVKCVGHNCKGGGCALNGRRTGCKPCSNRDGVCDSDVNYSGDVNDPDFSALIEILNKILDKLLKFL